MRRLIFMMLLLAPLSGWGEIYRWTDASGQVHFGEQPGPGAQAIQVKPQVMERDAATVQSQERLQKVLDAHQDELAASAQKQATKVAKRDEECGKLRQAQADLGRGGQFFSEDADGERTYYSDQQIAAALGKLNDQLAANCQ